MANSQADSANSKIRVLIADDQEMIRQGLTALLSAGGEIDVLDNASNGLEAVTMAEELQPDLVLMDIRMPGLDGVEATRRITSQFPKMKVLILTTYEEDEMILESLRAGASGYVLKNLPTEQLVTSIKSVHHGIAQLDPTVLAKMVGRLGTAPKPKSRNEEAFKHLTEREIAVLKLLSTGKSNKEISLELHLSEGTVKSHITHILTKLDLRDRTQAAIWALDHEI